MTNERTHEQAAQALLDRTGQLPRAIAPDRDLWPRIESALKEPLGEQQTAQDDAEHTGAANYLHRWQAPAALAASLLLAVFFGYWIGQEDAPVPSSISVAALQPVSLVEEVGLLEARRTMAAEIESGLYRLPPDARLVVIENLTAIHAALDEIDAVLARAPASGLDRQLLISMYADQISRLNSVQTLVMNSNQEILL